MSAIAEILPLTETIAPADQPSLVAAVASAYEGGTPIYPIGGGTALDFGLPPSRQGLGISLAQLNRVIDYPARDMTITIEAGITMRALAETLAAERQWLPIDAPLSETATLGGVMATNHSGPRRFGYGTMRDYVIGVSAVDGRGSAFKAGGRVVKNVAGYDFCKLLTGSLGTLGIITQVTLKVRPIAEASAFAICDFSDWATAEQLLAALVNSRATPAAVELLVGPHWQDHPALGLQTAGTLGRLAVGLEGTAAEVDWMLARLATEWREQGIESSRSMSGADAAPLWTALTDFPTGDAPLVLQASMIPSRVTSFMELARKSDSNVSLAAHAASGIVTARFAQFEAGDVSRALIGQLQPAARLAGGNAVVLSTSLTGLTRQATWGGTTGATPWMNRVKQQFDPKGLLNPDRFVYDQA